MSQQLYETVNRQEEYMDTWTQAFLKFGKDDLYCWECLSFIETDCCDKQTPMKLKDFPTQVQQNIAKQEYEKAYGK